MRSRALALLLGATLALTGCTSDKDKAGEPMDSTLTIDQAVDHYNAFSDAVIDRLGAEFGTRPWETAADSGGRAYCGEGDSGLEAVLPRRRFEGTYPIEQRDAVRDLVIAVGKENGFRDPELVVERPDYLKIVAEDEVGARYTFAMSVNTILSTSTGCHAAG
nr:LppA family lipoprotein [Nocardioides cavernaquae]